MSALPKQQTEALVAELPKPKGPGARLRATRIAQKKEIDLVAAQLHLTHDMIVALEADDYDHLPARVFVLGYLKNYARHVGLPAEAIVQAFNNYLPPEETKQALPTVGSDPAGILEPGSSANRTVMGMMTWLIVVGLFALFVIWWRGYLSLPDVGLEKKFADFLPSASSMNQAEDNSPTLSIPLQLTVSGTPPAIASTEAAGVKTEAPVSQVNAQSAAESAGTIALPEPASDEVIAEAEATESQMAETSVAMAAPAPLEVLPEVAVNKPEIVINFKDACWVDIRGANKSFRLFGEMVAGSSKTLGGEAPYKILFGNAAAVKMAINGVPYDFQKFTKANVTRFTLEQTDIIN